MTSPPSPVLAAASASASPADAPLPASPNPKRVDSKTDLHAGNITNNHDDDAMQPTTDGTAAQSDDNAHVETWSQGDTPVADNGAEIGVDGSTEEVVNQDGIITSESPVLVDGNNALMDENDLTEASSSPDLVNMDGDSTQAAEQPVNNVNGAQDTQPADIEPTEQDESKSEPEPEVYIHGAIPKDEDYVPAPRDALPTISAGDIDSLANTGGRAAHPFGDDDDDDLFGASTRNEPDTSKFAALAGDLFRRLDEILRDAQLIDELEMALAASPAALELKPEEQYRVVKVLGVPYSARPDDLGHFFESKLPPGSIVEVSMQMRPHKDAGDSPQDAGGKGNGSFYGNDGSRHGYRNRRGGPGGAMRGARDGGGLAVAHGPKTLPGSAVPQYPTLVAQQPQVRVRHGGWAYITLARAECMEMLLSLSLEDLRFQGRTLRVSEGFIKSVNYGSYRHHRSTFSARLHGMRLGLPPQSGIQTVTALPGSSYVTQDRAMFFINGTKDHRQVAVSFKKGQYRAEFSLRSMYRPVLFTGKSVDGRKLGEPVLRIHLRAPALIFADRDSPFPGDEKEAEQPKQKRASSPDADIPATNGHIAPQPVAPQGPIEVDKEELTELMMRIRDLHLNGQDTTALRAQAREMLQLYKKQEQQRLAAVTGPHARPLPMTKTAAAAPENTNQKQGEENEDDEDDAGETPQTEWYVWTEKGKFREVETTVKYERSPDPSGDKDGAFGRCTVMDLYLGPDTDQGALMEVLRRVSRPPTVVHAGIPELRTGLVEPGKLNDWADGYADCFKDLPWNVNYLLHGLLANRNIWFTCQEDAQQVADLVKENLELAALALEHQLSLPPPPQNSVAKLVNYIKSVYEHGDLVDPIPVPSSVPDIDRIATRGIIITPLRIVPQPPEADSGNRVLRTHADHADRFIRVTLADETMGTFKSASNSARLIAARVRPTLHSHVIVGGRRFVFLAYGNSQLREGSCWFYDEDPRPDDEEPCPTADDIRASIGDLSEIKIPGKFAARLGQAFSSTRPTVEVPAQMMGEIEDIERNGYCFSDGVGRISAKLASIMADQLHLLKIPSAYQVRIGGCKGMVTVDPRIGKRDKQLVVRPSMTKFPGWAHRVLEVCSVAYSYPCFLNRQVIMILITLGVKEETIMDYMKDMMDSLSKIMDDEIVAVELMRNYGMFQPAVPMLDAGFRITEDRHLHGLVKSLRDRMLLDLKYRARIFVPDGLYLVGVLDEWDVLEEDEVWFASSIRDPIPPGTKLLIGRSPCLHPGDLRVVTMARRDHDELAHLRDVVVFSQRGSRPLPNMLAGGDLDGDNFLVIWDERLLPPNQVPPMDYTPPGLPKEYKDGVSVANIIDFFVDFMVQEQVGLIANAHVAWADRLGSANTPECLELAYQHSVAVDFAKTGIPPSYNSSMAPPAYPDFLQTETRAMYESESVLGHIYRWACQVIDETEADKSLPDVLHSSDDNGYDPRIPAYVPDHNEYMEDALRLMFEYSGEMLKAAVQYEVLNEAELVTGFVRRDNKKNSRRRDRGRSGAEGPRAVAVIMHRFREEFWAEFDLDEEDIDGRQREERREDMWRDPSVLAKAAAWYKAAYHEVPKLVKEGANNPEQDGGDNSNIKFKSFLSFAWLVAEPVCFIKRVLEHQDAGNAPAGAAGAVVPNGKGY
ncbi:RNA dependent RNA polymerase-domain-containing protein [Catenaria anguillulae PL171]|uniref:RNA-directed RNA polymerase n=1 Tax=Catenaria anguillulae PL171 TaxID=765915 RepID=A0A1Y2HE32_9FUNG|nr:RNA dependent RNA polymerase-domain-containing protein [Catenaria anguillulae PL171]